MKYFTVFEEKLVYTFIDLIILFLKLQMDPFISNINKGPKSFKKSQKSVFYEKNKANVKPINNPVMKSELSLSNINGLNNAHQFYPKLHPIPLPVISVSNPEYPIQYHNNFDLGSSFSFHNSNNMFSNQIKIHDEPQLKNIKQSLLPSFQSLKKPNGYLPSMYEDKFIKEINENKRFLMSNRFKNNIGSMNAKNSNEYLEVDQNLQNDIQNDNISDEYNDHKDKTSKKFKLKISGVNHFLFKKGKNIFKKLIHKMNLENKNKFKICFEDESEDKAIETQFSQCEPKKIKYVLEDGIDPMYFNEINLNIKNIIQNTFLKNMTDNQKYEEQFIQSVNLCYESLYILNDKNLTSENLFKILNLQISINKDKFRAISVDLRLKFIIMIFSKFVNRKLFINNIENFLNEIDFTNENQIKQKIFR